MSYKQVLFYTTLSMNFKRINVYINKKEKNFTLTRIGKTACSRNNIVTKDTL